MRSRWGGSVQLRIGRGATRTIGRLMAGVALAATAGIMLDAAAAPARLVGVTAEGDAVLIESTEPAAYSVSRPDPLTLVVDMRNVSISDAKSDVAANAAISSVRLEQATAGDGREVARIHVSLARPSEHVVRSARNTIRVELVPRAGAPAARKTAAKAATPVPQVQRQATPQPALAQPLERAATDLATVLERIRSTKTPSATTITLIGNGRLAPTAVVESKDRPRRLVLDFSNVASKAPTQTAVDSALVTRVRVGLNSHQPLVTRVVMEIANGASYRVARSGESGRDLDVVFESSGAPAPIVLPEAAAEQVAPEPPISMAQAMANAAAIVPKEDKPEIAAQPTAPADPMTALRASAVQPPVSNTSRPATIAARQDAAPARTSSPASGRTARPAQVPESTPAQTAPSGVAVLQQQAQPPAQPSPPPGGTTTTQQESQTRQYTGHTISLDFEGVDLRAVLRTFADVSGLNMVIDPDVQGTVDIKLTDVPWDQALDIILKGNQLDYSVDGTIVRISKIATIEAENKARQSAAQAAAERAAQAGGLTFETFPLSYAKAADMVPLLKGSLRLSKHGNVQFDTRTNTLIIADLPEQFPAIRQLLTTLDQAEPQVEIEARIITTTRDFARAIGIQWGLNGRMTPEIGNTTNLAFPNSGVIGGRTGQNGAPGPVVNLPVPGPSAIGLALGSVNGAFNLDIALSALERSGKGRILSTPRITTQNNVEAEITQGVQIPLVTPATANNPETVTYKDAALTLRVTPQITASNTVIMQINIENASPGEARGNNVQIDTQRANTRVQVSDGATTVMGGVFISREIASQDRTPALYRLPLLGWLFKRDNQTDESRELLIFITPRILKG